jgi:hypothetical protein
MGPGDFLALNGALVLMYEPAKALGKLHILLQKCLAATTKIFELMDRVPGVQDAPDGRQTQEIQGPRPVPRRHVFLRQKKGSPPSTTSTSSSPPAAPAPSSARPARAKAPCSPCSCGFTTRKKDTSPSTVRTSGASPSGRCATRSPWSTRTSSSSTTPSTKTSATAGSTPPRRKSRRRPAAPTPTTSSWLTRTATSVMSATAAATCPEASASGFPSPAPSCATPRSCCSTRPLPHSTAKPRPRSRADLDELAKNRTVIAIAHRLSTILRADQIVVLEHGRITDIGTHAELLQRSERYQRVYRMQFESVLEPGRNPAGPRAGRRAGAPGPGLARPGAFRRSI